MEEIGRRLILKSGRTLIGSKKLPASLKSMFQPQNTFMVPLTWNNATLEAIRACKPAVTICARALAIVHTCMFDAWAAYDRRAHGTCYGSTLRRPPQEHTLNNKEEAISYAAYRALVDLFPTQCDQFSAILQQLGYDPHDTAINAYTPAGIGNMVATAILSSRHHDGSNQIGDLHPDPYSDYTDYKPLNDSVDINDPSSWQPLCVPTFENNYVIQPFMTPHWGLVRPFAMTSGSQFRAIISPAEYGSDLYYQQAYQILTMSANLTNRQKVIVEYWMDGPSFEQPPGHWCLIAQYLIRRDSYNLDNAIKLFFILANGLLDASIACWDIKRTFNSERPITAIHFLFKNRQIQAWAGPYQGTQLIQGQDWRPYQPNNVITPAFPEFCSGHSTFSSLSATILSWYSGSDYFGGVFTYKAGTSRIEPGKTPATDITLSWKTFREAANEAGLSRLYGGIHFEQGDLTGRLLGIKVAAQVWQQAQTYIQGHTIQPESSSPPQQW